VKKSLSHYSKNKEAYLFSLASITSYEGIYKKNFPNMAKKETADTNNDKDNQDELGHDERVDIFYDLNKVSKGDIFIK
jgi:hypothetical protein